MKIKYSELRRNYTLDYTFDGETITVNYNNEITDTFDLSNFAEGDKFQGVETEIPVKIFDSVERVDGVLKVVLFKPYGNEIAQEVMQKGDKGFPFSREWQVV